ncbi:unnamed protein product [Ilex paraguariensis]|uniref:Seipin n=1 Tax=Ilex paraguariensis TaxID=185542 RepID=A0ABC8S757_9AQUA
MHMEQESETSTSQNDDIGDHFFNSSDDFPFYDCIDASDDLPFYDCIDATTTNDSLDSESDVSLNPNFRPTPGNPSLANLRRRRRLSQRSKGIQGSGGNDPSDSDSSVILKSTLYFGGRKFRFSQSLKESENLEENQTGDSKDPSTNSSVNVADREVNELNTSSVDINSREIKYGFSRILKENEKESENSDSIKPNKENKEKSTLTTANKERIDGSISVESRSAETVDTSSNFLIFVANLVIKAVGFQIILLFSFFAVPIWLLYCSYQFVMDPFWAVRSVKQYVIGKLLRISGLRCNCVSPIVYKWLKKYKSIWKLVLRLGWGFLWSVYVCVVLVGLLMSAFVSSGFVMRYLVEEPIQMKENLNFDYTKNSPVAFVPISDYLGVNCGVNGGEKVGIGKVEGSQVIPPDHKLHVSISLTLPESDYNRKLGMFQVRIDLLSTDGKALASSRHPCLLQFKSQPIHLLLTFLKITSLVTGYSSESQTVSVKVNLRGHEPTACLRVTMEQRAEFQSGAGIPEIYDASLTVESEPPLLKRVLWYWKKSIFIWISLMVLSMELFFTLLCCKAMIMPKVRLRDVSPSTGTPVQR